MLKANSDTPAKNQDWRKQYFDALESLEGERQQFRVLESALKRLAGRLCAASLGQSAQLDEQIKRLQTTIRREVTSDELDKITSALTDAIAKLEQPTAAPQPAVVPRAVAVEPTAVPGFDTAGSINSANVIDDRLRAILSALLAQLRRDSELTIRVDALDSKLVSTQTREQVADVMSSLAELVTLRIDRIERGKQEIEVLLNHMVGRLDEIGRFIADHNHNHSESLGSHESFNAQLTKEMKAMGESVESAVDLNQIRSQLRSRLDSIGEQLKDFREREAARANEMHTRNEQMQARMAELEAEATKLQHQLGDQQRLSTIDALTNVPNRLAYEKRIQEDLGRWQRFKHPTCVAVWDIDLFKNINDKHGHLAGDRVLRAVAESLAGRVRSTDFLARFGGEEFVMILCGTKIDEAVRLIDEMRIGISTLKFHTSGTPLPPVTVSIGVIALLPNDTAGAAFDRADKALYQAKKTGRNKCVRG